MSVIDNEQVFEELAKALEPYSDLIHELELMRLTHEQVSNILMLIYSYRFNNALDASKVSRCDTI